MLGNDQQDSILFDMCYDPENEIEMDNDDEDNEEEPMSSQHKYELWFVVVVILAFVLFSGDPDIVDAIRLWIDRQ